MSAKKIRHFREVGQILLSGVAILCRSSWDRIFRGPAECLRRREVKSRNLISGGFFD